jgi:hypothetical protein
MGWEMKAVEAPSSAIKYTLDQIPQDVKDGVEEAFNYCQSNPTERIVIPFLGTDDTNAEDQRDLTRGQVRSYCEQRPAGRLTASIWAVSVDPESGETSGDDNAVPALNMRFVPYVKREKKEQAS